MSGWYYPEWQVSILKMVTMVTRGQRVQKDSLYLTSFNNGWCASMLLGNTTLVSSISWSRHSSHTWLPLTAGRGGVTQTHTPPGGLGVCEVSESSGGRRSGRNLWSSPKLAAIRTERTRTGWHSPLPARQAHAKSFFLQECGYYYHYYWIFLNIIIIMYIIIIIICI